MIKTGTLVYFQKTWHLSRKQTKMSDSKMCIIKDNKGYASKNIWVSEMTLEFWKIVKYLPGWALSCKKSFRKLTWK